MKIRRITKGALVLMALPFFTFIKSAEEKYYRHLTSMSEYEAAYAARTPTIITFSSPTCSACDQMEPVFNGAAKKYKKAKFYTVNCKDAAFKELSKKVKIPAYPTTHFIRPGQEPRIERGSMGAEEFDDIAFECVNGKKKPRPTKPVSMKKSLQEKTT